MTQDQKVPQHLINFLEKFSTFLRTDIVAHYKPPVGDAKRGSYAPHRATLTRTDLENHVTGQQVLGLYVLPAELGKEGKTRAACLDLDDKKKEMTWEELCKEGKTLSDEANKYGLLAWPCRSGSGHGVHLWFFWNDPQPTPMVRKLLKKIVEEIKPKSHIDIFPAQDKLGENENGELQLGNLVAIPLGRESRPILNLDNAEVAENFYDWLPIEPALSRPVVAQAQSNFLKELEKDAEKQKGEFSETYSDVDPEFAAEALKFIDNEDYDTWMRIGMALKMASKDGQLHEEDAKKLWDDWSSTSEKYSPRDQDNNWRSMKPSGVLNIGIIWKLASLAGWKAKNKKRPEKTYDQVKKEMQPSLQGLSQNEKEAREDYPWLNGQATPDINKINREYFLAPEGSKTLIFKEMWDPMLKRHKLVRMSAHDFKLLHQNKKIVVGSTKQGMPITADLGTAWLDDVNRRQYESVTLQPEGCVPWVYNLWRGWTVEPSEDGSCEIFKQHVLENVCNSDKDVYDYLMKWCALTMQKPYEPIGVAIVLRGERGTGKGTFARVIGDLFGQHFLHLTNSRDLTGRFNSHLQDCILLFADEAVWAGSKSEESTLKGLITEPYLAIEGKGRDVVTCRNMIHLIIATNNEWSAPAGMDERRFLALKVGNKHKQSVNYFSKIWDELNNGGRERLLWELLNMNLKGFSPYDVPRTSELLEQKIKSLDAITEWWYDKISIGEILDLHHGDWTREIPLQALYLDYVSYCRLSGERRPGGMAHFSLRLQPLLPCKLEKKRARLKTSYTTQAGEIPQGTVQTIVQMPSLQGCRDFFNKLAQQNLDWNMDEIFDDSKPAQKRLGDDEAMNF